MNMSKSKMSSMMIIDNSGCSASAVKTSSSTISNMNPFDTIFSMCLPSYIIRKISEERSLYLIPIKFLIQGIESNQILFNVENRLVDKDRHFTDFDPILSDPIILAQRPDENFEVLDGQHRLDYLEKREDLWNDNILMDIRYCPTDETYKKYLEIINNRVVFNHLNLKKYKYTDILDLFQKSILFSKVRIGKNRPALNIDIFKSVIFSSKLFNDVHTTGKMIFDKIVSINRFASLLLPTELVTKGELKSEWIEKAQECGFFLTVDKNMSILKHLLDVDEDKYRLIWMIIISRKRTIKSSTK